MGTDGRRALVGVVDLHAARVVAEWRGRLPELLVGGCCIQPAGR
jgi:hypothetical protein